jgi:RecA-family ATPase
MDEKIDLREAIKYIDCADLSYQEWVNVGMALKYEGYSCSDWEEWSRSDSRYKRGECEKKWEGFNGSTTPVTAGTIVQMAKDRGFMGRNMGTLDWDDYIGVDKYDKAWVEPEPIKKASKIDPCGEIKRYINALFEPDDKVCIVTRSTSDKDGKSHPVGNGATRSAAQWLADLDKHKDDVGAVIGDYDKHAGAWVRFNPMDGKGIKNENVADFRYALIESDDMDLEMQNALIRDMKLPVAVLCYSGGKSLHAIVHIDAPGIEVYKQRVNKLYEKCGVYKLKIDTQNKNPSRLSRLPGVRRGEKWQYIIDTNIGLSSWEEWEEYIDEETDDFPDPEELLDGDAPVLPDSLIDGVLRQGGKMSLTGPSKAGKSFLLIQLGVALATGSEWLGFKCAKKKVLYINFEIEKNMMKSREWSVCEAVGIDKKEASENMHTWNLKGKIATMDKLRVSLVRRCRKFGYDVVIVDPIYKTLTGDENSATDMSRFTSYMDEVCNAANVSIIYAHHHSKGAQGSKSAADRSSGSGVFARDPDAIVDMIEIKPEDADGQPVEIPEGATAWRIESTLRDFRTPEPFEIVFDYPRHMRWEGLSGAGEMYGVTGYLSRREKQEKGRVTQARRKENNDMKLCAYIAQFTREEGRAPTLQEASNELGKGFSLTTLKQKAKEIEGMQLMNGMLFYTEVTDWDDDI